LLPAIHVVSFGTYIDGKWGRAFPA